MKKFLKVFIILLLVLTVIGVTCYFFFRNLKERNNTTPSFASFIKSEEKSEFDTNLSATSTWMKSEGNDDRLELLIEVNSNLNHIIFSLSTYNLETNTQINNKEISVSFNNKVLLVLTLLKETEISLLLRMLKEYGVKTSSNYFDRNEGANDIYYEMSNYLVEYANLSLLVNDYVSSVNKNSDVKFNVFNAYANIVKQAFSETVLQEPNVDEEELRIIKNSTNITKINQIVMFGADSSLMVDDRFSSNVNKFNEHYEKCDKQLFAKNFSGNIVSVASSNQDTEEKMATYYFSKVFGLL